MKRRQFVCQSVLSGLGLMTVASGCAGRQYAHILASDDTDMVGSHAAGSATWNPLVQSSVAQLLARCPPVMQTSAAEPAIGSSVATADTLNGVLPIATVCFIGIENKSAEELGDWKDQIYETIDSQINAADGYRGVSRRLIDAGLRETRLRPDSLFLPDNRQNFSAVLGRNGSPIDFLLYATITSGTTDRNKSSQRDYVLTLEMVNIHTGDFTKESAKLRKGYSRTRAGKWWNYGAFQQADG